VFTEEDRVVIKFQRQNRRYSARRLVKEFTLKNWNTGSLNKLLKKIDDTGSTAQLPGSGRRRTSELHDENVEWVGDTVPISLLRKILNACQN